MLRSIYLGALCAFILLCIISCSGGSAIQPQDVVQGSSGADGNHMLWGLYQFTADPVNGTLDVEPVRTAEFHLNALPFLEPPPFVYLSLESLQFNGDIIEADIGLRHPFLGLSEFTGFDVNGILITNGSYAGFSDSKLRYAGPGDTYLMNPDGHSRWWNPSEFPHNSGISGYKDGLLGTPDSIADYNSTINGYKYFCDDLTHPDDPLTEVTQQRRGMFSAGQKNVRHYTIKLGADALTFNYAVDASWEFPQGGAPWVVPDDFPDNANRVEPWFIEVAELANSLYFYNGEPGGSLSLTLNVYDWFNIESSALYIEAADGVIPKMGPIPPSGGGDGYCTYEIDIDNASPTAPGALGILFTVESEQAGFQGFITGTNTSAYLVYTVVVSDEPIVVHTVTGIFPAHGKPDCSLENVEVYGTNFMGGASLGVKLKMSGEPDIAATNPAFIDENTITCDLDIPLSAAVGMWDVEVTNGDGTKAAGEELFEIFDCGAMSAPATAGYIVTSPPGTMFGEWCGVTCTREGTSYLVATGPIHNVFAAIKATATGGSSEYTADAGGYLEYDLACTSDNIIYYAHAGDPSMVLQIPFDPATGFGSYSKFAPLTSKWFMHRVCVDDQDYPVVLGYDTGAPTPDVMKVFHWNGTAWDEFDVPKEVVGPGSKYIQDFDYNPILKQYVFVCLTPILPDWPTDLFALDSKGTIVHHEKDIFSWNHEFAWWAGLYINQDEPDCRIFVWGCFDYYTANGRPRPCARYDAFYGNKATADVPTTYGHGPGEPRGAWAPGTNRLFTPSMGGNVISWFTLPNDW